MNIANLQAALRHFAAEREWQSFHTPKNLATALMVEAAELAEVFQWMTPEESREAHLDAVSKQRIGEEIAPTLRSWARSPSGDQIRKQQCRMACGGGRALSRLRRWASQPLASPEGSLGTARTNSTNRAGKAMLAAGPGSIVGEPPLQCSWHRPGWSGSIVAMSPPTIACAQGMPAIERMLAPADPIEQA